MQLTGEYLFCYTKLLIIWLSSKLFVILISPSLDENTGNNIITFLGYSVQPVSKEQMVNFALSIAI